MFHHLAQPLTQESLSHIRSKLRKTAFLHVRLGYLGRLCRLCHAQCGSLLYGCRVQLFPIRGWECLLSLTMCLKRTSKHPELYTCEIRRVTFHTTQKKHLGWDLNAKELQDTLFQAPDSQSKCVDTAILEKVRKPRLLAIASARGLGGLFPR